MWGFPFQLKCLSHHQGRSTPKRPPSGRCLYPVLRNQSPAIVRFFPVSTVDARQAILVSYGRQRHRLVSWERHWHEPGAGRGTTMDRGGWSGDLRVRCESPVRWSLANVVAHRALSLGLANSTTSWHHSFCQPNFLCAHRVQTLRVFGVAITMLFSPSQSRLAVYTIVNAVQHVQCVGQTTWSKESKSVKLIRACKVHVESTAHTVKSLLMKCWYISVARRDWSARGDTPPIFIPVGTLLAMGLFLGTCTMHGVHVHVTYHSYDFNFVRHTVTFQVDNTTNEFCKMKVRLIFWESACVPPGMGLWRKSLNWHLPFAVEGH